MSRITSHTLRDPERALLVDTLLEAQENAWKHKDNDRYIDLLRLSQAFYNATVIQLLTAERD